jgi:hypothetical protein
VPQLPLKVQEAIERDGPNDPTVNPNPAPLPASWYAADLSAWIGKPWRQIDLFKLMPRWPSGMDQGKRFVVFYSRTCEHCEQMFQEDLIFPLAAPVTAVEIPASATQLTDEGAWDMPPTDCELLPLPLGCRWIINAPLTLAVENGIITCATEGDHKECMELP